MVLHREDTPVDSILERAAASHRARAQAEGMAVSVESSDALRARVDRERLRQALDDLIDNSLRHARPGTNVRLSAQRSDGRLLVTVRDDGPGFPPDLLDGDGEGSASGTGLGLSVVRAIAEAHGGALRLGNEVPRGASASIELPP
jgi:signal transduction histidine kinase